MSHVCSPRPSQCFVLCLTWGEKSVGRESGKSSLLRVVGSERAGPRSSCEARSAPTCPRSSGSSGLSRGRRHETGSARGVAGGLGRAPGARRNARAPVLRHGHPRPPRRGALAGSLASERPPRAPRSRGPCASCGEEAGSRATGPPPVSRPRPPRAALSGRRALGRRRFGGEVGGGREGRARGSPAAPAPASP